MVSRIHNGSLHNRVKLFMKLNLNLNFTIHFLVAESMYQKIKAVKQSKRKIWLWLHNGVQPKPGLSIGKPKTKVLFLYQYQSWNLFLPETFFFFFSKMFLMFSYFLEDISFEKFDIEHIFTKKIFNIWQQIWFYIGLALLSELSVNYSISPKVSAILHFSFRIWPKPK